MKFIFPGTAAWRRFWRGAQWSKHVIEKTKAAAPQPLEFNLIRRMKADDLLKLAQQYILDEGSAIDTVEITAFVEWVYRKEGRDVPSMSLLAEIERLARENKDGKSLTDKDPTS